MIFYFTVSDKFPPPAIYNIRQARVPNFISSHESYSTPDAWQHVFLMLDSKSINLGLAPVFPLVCRPSFGFHMKYGC